MGINPSEIKIIPTEDFKAYYLIRSDLNMSVAKIGVQVGHGTDSIHILKDGYFLKWLRNHRKKIVLKIKSEDELTSIAHKLDSDNIKYNYIVDNGLTELNGITNTGIVIFPIEGDKAPKYIKRLQLYK